MSWLWTSPAASASRRRATRVQRPSIVRPPWASRVSWPLQVQNTDSIHWRTGPSDPWRRRSSWRSGLRKGAERGHVGLELGAREAFVAHDGVAIEVDAVEHFGGHDALGDVRGRELEADR